MGSLSRRRFLGVAGGATGAVLAGGILSQPKAVASTPANPEGYKAIIIGSGFGGSISALRLAQAGVKSLILERGQHYTYSPTAAVFGDEVHPNSDCFWFETTATWPTVPPIPINAVPGILEVNEQTGITAACGAAVGGGSLTYTGCTVQPVQKYFEALWPAGVSYAEMDSVYWPLARRMLGAATVPPDIYQSDPFTHSRAFDQQMAAAGYPTTPVPSDFNWAKVRGELSGTLRPSAIIGESTFGNSDGAKNDMTQTYLPLALSTGKVTISPLTQVTGIQVTGKGQYLVDVEYWNTDGSSAGAGQYQADMLFMAAGSINTTKLLVAARDSGALPNLSSYVGANWGSNGDAFALRTYSGPTGASQAAPCASTAFVDDCYGVPTRIENWYAMAFDGSDETVQFSVAVDMENRGTWTYDSSTGTVSLSGWTEASNSLTQNAAEEFNQMIIEKGLAGTSPYSAPPGLTAHPLGGVEIGRVTDLYGRVPGYPGMYVIDASLFPGNVGGANPSLTVAALAERNIANIIAQGG